MCGVTLEKIRAYRASLNENLVNGNLSREEHKSLKAKYTKDADLLVAANGRLQTEIEAVLACRHERMMWTEHFRKFEALDAIDRKTVIHLIHSIKVMGKTDLEITFNYQLEYENAVAVLAKEAA